MQSASRLFRHTSLVQGLQQATLICAMGGVLAWATPVGAQTGWRTVSPVSSGPAVVVTPIPEAVAPEPKVQAQAQAQAPADGGLQMFGVTLSTATRADMRQAIRNEGLKPQREDDAFQEDIYEALNWMPGLLQMKFSYAPQGQRLARVDYLFMTFSDNAHVEDVKLRIEGRFGRPQSVTGREQSGPYQAIWRLPDQMEIFVAREWPQKTTQLRFTNLPVWGQMRPYAARENGQPIRRERNQNNQALPMWVSR
jgi:hypothetical protein